MSELENQLIDLFLDKRNDWKCSKPEYDLDNVSGVKVIIDPENAKSLDEVESFIVEEEVIGDVRWHLTRIN